MPIARRRIRRGISGRRRGVRGGRRIFRGGRSFTRGMRRSGGSGFRTSYKRKRFSKAGSFRRRRSSGMKRTLARARKFFGSSRGTLASHERSVYVDFRDAIKAGFNTVPLTEVTNPAQDYRMVTMFYEDGQQYHEAVANSVASLAAAVTSNPASNVVPAMTSGSTFVEYDMVPFFMQYYIMNPSISTIQCWVEVWAIRPGFAPRVSIADDWLRFSDDNAVGPVYTGMIHTINTSTTTQARPSLHNVSLSTANGAAQWPNSTAANANALTAHMAQVFDGRDSWRRRAYKLLSKRKMMVIPPGAVQRFRVRISYMRRTISQFADDATYPDYFASDRLVVIKWNTLMGTVASALESTHLSEKVHIVVARKAKIHMHMIEKSPKINIQMVNNHDATNTNYIASAVSEHIQRMEVTKTAQQLEQVP
uniref:Hypothetical capsid protein n=1 Tax=uncultured virus TaxID=340016 RepID=A0A1D8MJY9_9VIRU|nr:hypothetical capsid protein [uncultured virus]AOV86270.1 hypothetical capsid protein [uncultured virus]